MDTHLPTHIARVVSTRSLALHLLPHDIAVALSISRSDVIALLQGTLVLTFAQAICLAQLLQIPLAALAHETDQEALEDICILAAELPTESQRLLVPFLRAVTQSLARVSGDRA